MAGGRARGGINSTKVKGNESSSNRLWARTSNLSLNTRSFTHGHVRFFYNYLYYCETKKEVEVKAIRSGNEVR